MDEWSGETSHVKWTEDKLGLALVVIPAVGGLLNLVAAPIAVLTHGPSLLFSVIIGALVLLASMVAASRDARGPRLRCLDAGALLLDRRLPAAHGAAPSPGGCISASAGRRCPRISRRRRRTR